MLISFNGVLTNADDKIFNSHSRIFKYGDGFFESIKLIQNKAQLFDLHYDRILRASHFFHLPLNPKWTKEYFIEHLEWLSLKNGLSHARCKMIFYRDSDGLYMPEKDKTGFIIELKESTSKYKINDKGLKLSDYPFILKGSNFLSFFKSMSSQQYVLAAIHARNNDFNAVLMYNETGRVAEAHHSNVFIIKDSEIITPPLSEYCLDGVMRHFLIDQFKLLGHQIKELPISEQDILEADEMFLCNATQGMMWVENYKDRFYQFQTIFAIHAQIFGV